MRRRVGAVLVLAVAIVVATVAFVVHRSDDVPVARAAPAAAATPARTTTGTSRQPTIDVAPVAPIDPAAPAAVEVAKTDGVAFARAYADALCACTAAACLDQVRERYARNTGEAQPSNDVRALHEAFVRGQACIQTVRALRRTG